MARDIAVGFDLDHTLGIDNLLEKTVALAMLADRAQRRGVTYDVAAAEKAIGETLHAMRSGDVSVELGIAGFFGQFVAGGERLDVIDEAEDYREAVLAKVGEHMTALPGMRELLAGLEAMGVAYGVLSNGWSPLQEEKARALEIFAPVFVSERIGARKPARAAFESLEKLFALPAGKIWYVGDDPIADCVGATEAGMVAVWLDAERRPYPPDATYPAHTIHALGELLPLLREALGAAPV